VSAAIPGVFVRVVVSRISLRSSGLRPPTPAVKELTGWTVYNFTLATLQFLKGDDGYGVRNVHVKR
jgi:hypothetical protein